MDETDYKRTSEFLRLAEAGDLAGVTRLLSEGFPVDASVFDGETALCRAAELGLADMARLLLDAKADPNCDAHWRPLARAVSGFGDRGLMTALLLSEGADPEGRSGNYGVAALHEAECAKAAELLIHAGADIEVLDARGETPIVAAVNRGIMGVAFVLLDAGADAGKVVLCDRDAARRFSEAAASREADELGILIAEGRQEGGKGHGRI